MRFSSQPDNFGRINIVVNNAGIAETGNVVEATGRHLGQGVLGKVSWARHPGLRLRGEFAIWLCDNEGRACRTVVTPGSKAALNQLIK
jgi:hypothetical protein